MPMIRMVGATPDWLLSCRVKRHGIARDSFDVPSVHSAWARRRPSYSVGRVLLNGARVQPKPSQLIQPRFDSSNVLPAERLY
jgi:hypothetical protein